MGLFKNETALALMVGELKADVALLKTQVAALQTELAKASVEMTESSIMPVAMQTRGPMPSAVLSTVARLAGHDSQLQRHLLSEASLMLADETPVADVCAALMRGAAH